MTTPLWTKDAFVAALKGEVFGSLPETIEGISIDSRTLQKGEAFFAVKGDQFDGHDFAEKAAQNGAGVLVVAHDKAALLQGLSTPLVVVDDVLAALSRLGMAARARSKAKIIAVTGSVGKTTTKEALRHVLADLGKVHANPASFNNHWGVPLTLARMPQDADYAIFEIGMNHADEIRSLVKMVRPHIAVITLIAAAHLGHFKNIEAIADAKAEIFEGVIEGGYVLLNADDPFFAYLKNKAQGCGVHHIRSFGEAESADYRLLDVRLLADCSCFSMKIGQEDALVKIGAPGRHIVQNALAVIGVADLAGADAARVVMALSDFTPERGRGARYTLSAPGGSFVLIDESYNANPTSMRAALDLFAATEPGKRGRRIAVFGDMLELGAQSAKLHRELSAPICDANVDTLYLIGSEMKALADIMDAHVQTIWRRNADEILPFVLSDVRAGDVVMVKSSNGLHSSRIVSALIERYKAAQTGNASS